LPKHKNKQFVSKRFISNYLKKEIFSLKFKDSDFFKVKLNADSYELSQKNDNLILLKNKKEKKEKETKKEENKEESKNEEKNEESKNEENKEESKNEEKNEEFTKIKVLEKELEELKTQNEENNKKMEDFYKYFIFKNKIPEFYPGFTSLEEVEVDFNKMNLNDLVIKHQSTLENPGAIVLKLKGYREIKKDDILTSLKKIKNLNCDYQILNNIKTGIYQINTTNKIIKNYKDFIDNDDEENIKISGPDLYRKYIQNIYLGKIFILIKGNFSNFDINKIENPLKVFPNMPGINTSFHYLGNKGVFLFLI
jgi:flagellar biosynthesis GTPase FlhF